MNKLNLLIIILIGITILACSSDDNIQNAFNQSQKLIKKITVSQNGISQSILTFEYDNSKLVSLTNDLDRKTEYAYLGSQLDYESILEYNFQTEIYDLEYEQTDFEYENNILKSDVVTVNGNPIQKHDYFLQSSGKIVLYNFFNFTNNQWNSGGSRIFEYSYGNIIQEVQTDNTDAVVFKLQYTYDDKKHPLKNLDIQIKRRIWGYRLNAMNENNILSYATYDENNNLLSSFSYAYQYDADGFPIEREKTDSNGQVVETISYEYE